ncbi:MAG TPA: hypothetical protein VK008_01410 [Sphingobacteriaceae bacterium]|nr:hypothetical protein [Sphingobacteriaceae bacterium]
MTTKEATQEVKTVRRPDPLERVNTWPHFLIIEFIGLMIFTGLLIILSIVLRAPLLELAQPEYTINPAKAPWYFLNLQELLLHMHPTLAGVLLPTVALILIAAIPYIDKDEAGTGVWFTSRKGWAITKFSFIYTTVWVVGLVLFSEFIGTRQALSLLGLPPAVVDVLGGIVVPIVVMSVIPGLLVSIVRRRWQADTRHVIIALFTMFVASYVVLTIIGTGFRGDSMRLVWPWQLEHPK